MNPVLSETLPADTPQTSCRKCGNCCRQGGPSLHDADLGLVRTGKIPISSLIAIRKGELTENPLVRGVHPVGVELVKIVGTGREWDCCYYDVKWGCTIYEYRPLACVLLKCWDTGEILDIVEKETLSRLDILDSKHPLVPVIQEHERIFPLPDLMEIRGNRGRLSYQLEKELEKLVRGDLRFRTRVIRDFDLKLSEELFYFGRPLFQLLQPLGAFVTESSSGIILNWQAVRR
ncbi:MAG: YkgJ family cysteine cluster protein [Deltaproteobacteria bacterium]|nr:YkgJ family cysteine cluster protein [Deltaproteobacteria bacterium]MBW2658209.1 YkgJ family cysteine cluster protein [Deltaproteobacteria bacterium]